MPGTTEIKTDCAHRLVLSNASELSKYDYVSLLGLEVGETSELLKRISKGFPYSSWEHFLRNTRLHKEEALGFVQMAPRTLSRRKEEGRLHADESDRLLRAARVFARTLDLFEGDTESARQWLRTSQQALDGAAPIEYSATELGAREVEALIGRLEHGIPS